MKTSFKRIPLKKESTKAAHKTVRIRLIIYSFSFKNQSVLENKKRRRTTKTTQMLNLMLHNESPNKLPEN